MISNRSDLNATPGQGSLLIGDILLPLRLVVGWTYFSAFWRRLVLENKLIPDAPGYIGEKFNHFLPNAIIIKPVIEFFVSQPVFLWWQLAVFTAVEAVVGLALMAGFVTRLVGIATSLLAFGILLGAGWLGTTCLDEWQIGVLGLTAGLVCALAGGGRYSVDHGIVRRFPRLLNTTWGQILFAPAPENSRLISRLTLVIGMAVLALTLATNQVFHGGVWGPLYNKSVRPKLEITDAQMQPDGLHFTAQRVEGADVYGSFVVEAKLLDQAGREQAIWASDALAKTPISDIQNRFVAKIKPGPHGLIFPLGAKATLVLHHEALRQLASGAYTLELLDVSGAHWSVPVKILTTLPDSNHAPAKTAPFKRESNTYTKSVDRPYEQVVSAVKEAAQAQGFRVSNVRDIAASLHKEGFDREPLATVEMCSPEIAAQLLKIEPTLGSAMPCRIEVFQKGSRTVVSMLLPSSAMGLISEKPEAQQIARDVDGKLKAVIDTATR